jgi:hypothetical protein
MKFELKNNFAYKSLLFITRIPFTKWTFKFFTMGYRSPDTWVTGYSSRTKQGRYTGFFDWDNLDLGTIKEEIKYLQNKYSLSDFYIFKLDRKNSFHAVCLDAQSMMETYTILKDSSCDQAFIHAIKNMDTREWILRVGKKGDRKGIKYLEKVKSAWNQKVRSSAHASILKKFGVKIENENSGRWDKNKELRVIRYNTANRTKQK